MAALTSALAFAPSPRRAAACAGRPAAPLSALPGPGATEVSPHTSIRLVTGTSTLPSGLTLEADGQPVPLPAIRLVGSGLTDEGSATHWQLEGALAPSTSYVLRARDGGAPRELTRFSTAARYDKAPGTAPVLSRLRLWRVRYDASQVGAGACAFDEHEGYVDVEQTPAAVPGTPPEELVHVLSLRPSGGGDVQTFVFSGLTRFPGARVEAPGGSGLVEVPPGGRPSPAFAAWKPTLAAGREYCATMRVYGRNDRAMPLVESNTICARVASVDARSGTSGLPGDEAGGCTLGGGGRASAPLLLGLLAASLARMAARLWRR